MRKTLALFIILLITPSAWGDRASIGTTAAGFLKIGVGARAVSMGEAYTAVTDGADSLYWNPAGLASVSGNVVTFMHSAYIDSSYFDYLAYAHNLESFGTLGLGVQYFSAGEIMQTDEDGFELTAFTPNDMAISLGYAYRFNDTPKFFDGFSFGITGKLIQSKLIDTAQTFAIDFGIITPKYLNGKLIFALTAQNLARKIKYDQESEPLPTTIKAGSSINIIDKWIMSLDITEPKDNDVYLAIGNEYTFIFKDKWSIAGRLGLNTRTKNDLEGLSGVSAGFGVALKTISLDYAFLPFGSLGHTHRLSLGYKFSE